MSGDQVAGELEGSGLTPAHVEARVLVPTVVCVIAVDGPQPETETSQ